MILKLLLIIGVISIVYFMFIKKKPTNIDAKSKQKEKPQANDMVECAQCGVYCEIEEAILSNGKYYCSKECIAEVR